MTATAGFLHEPYPAHVAHSRLSASFVTKPSYLDATMFLCQTAAPAAMHMAGATQRFGQSQRPCESAFNVAQNSSVPLTNIFEQRSKIQRQWPAYLRHALGGDAELSVIDVLSCLDWLSLGKATVVEVSLRAMETIRVSSVGSLVDHFALGGRTLDGNRTCPGRPISSAAAHHSAEWATVAR